MTAADRREKVALEILSRLDLHCDLCGGLNFYDSTWGSVAGHCGACEPDVDRAKAMIIEVLTRSTAP